MISILASAVIIGGGTALMYSNGVDLATSVSAASIVTKGDYMYTEVSGGVKFMGYAPESYDETTDKDIVHTPKTSTMSIPSAINGKTVVAIGTLQNVDDYMDECTKIVIPNTVKTIDKGVFEDWENVTTITFSGTSVVTTIGERAFANVGVSSITIPNSVTSVGKEAFAECENLKTVTFTNSTLSSTIGERAFAECEALTKVTFSNSVISIGKEAFAECENLATADLTNCTKLTRILDSSFEGTALKSIVIPSGVTTIGNSAFADIKVEDVYGDEIPVNITFKTVSTNKIKIDKSAFEGTYLNTVSVPQLAYNTTAGVISAETFNKAKKLTVNSQTQQVTDLDDTDIEYVVSPYGSYIWAAIYRGTVDDNESAALAYVKNIKGSEMVYNYSADKKNVAYSAITLTEGSNLVIKYDSSISKTDVKKDSSGNSYGAKNLVVTAKLGYTDIELSTVTQIKKFFLYSDIMSTEYKGAFTLKNIVNSSGTATGVLRIKDNATITKAYTVAAENFANAKVTFNTTKDVSSGIYNTTYKTYVSASDTTAVKPTVIVTLNGKTVASSCYTVTYKNNVGLTGNASVVVTLTDAGKKLYNSGTVTQSFSVKRDISKVNLYAKGTIANNKTTTGANLMYADSSKSAFLPITGTSYKIASSNYYLSAKINGEATTFAPSSSNFTVSYGEDAFNEYSGVEFQDLALGEVTCTIKAASSNKYFFGTRNISYFTRYNIANLPNITLMDGDNEYEVKKTTDSAKESMYYSTAFTYNGYAYTPTLVLSQGGSQGGTVSSTYCDYTYANNLNISANGTKSALGKVKISVSTSRCSYLYGTQEVYFKITQRDISDIPEIFSTPSSQIYTGSAITPTITGAYLNKALKLGTDYTVAYYNNTNAGTATVTITGKGNFKGTCKKTFTIGKVSLSKCTVAFKNSGSNVVSYRFGLEIKPIVEVTYNGKTLVSGDDYNVVYIGEQVDGKWTGVAPYLTGKTGGVVIVPTGNAKSNFFGVDADNSLLTYSYGTQGKTVTGVLKEYTTDALTLDHITIGFNPKLESGTLDEMRTKLAPVITINGRGLYPSSPSTLQKDLATRYQKANPKKTWQQCLSYAQSKIPSMALNANGSKKSVRAYYGYYKTTTEYVIVGMLVPRVDSVSDSYWNVQDDFFIQNTAESKTRTLIATFCYTTDASVAATKSSDYKGLQLQKYSYTYRGQVLTRTVVKPGTHHIYTMNANVTGYTAGLSKNKVWDFNIAPSKPYVAIEGYEVDKVPGKTTVKFSPSSSDKFDGKTSYTINFYKTKAEATSGSNPIHSVSVKYSSSSTSLTTAGLSIVTNKTKAFGDYRDYYSYTVTELDYGRSYFVTVTATDDTTKISSSASTPEAFLSSTTMATIDSISYKQSGQNFVGTVVINQPANKLSEAGSGGKAHIYYVLSIYTSDGKLLTTYHIDSSKTEGYKQFASDGKTVNLGAIAGMKSTVEYYATLETYLAYNTGEFTDTTAPVKCNYAQIATNVLGLMPTKTYQMTFENRFSASIALSRTVNKEELPLSVINSGQSMNITATPNAKGTSPYTMKFDILNSAGTVISTKTYTGVTGAKTHSYTGSDAGTCTARITVTDKNGVSSTTQQQFTVVKALTNSSSLSVTTIPVGGNITVNLGSANGYGAKYYTVKVKSPYGKTATLISDSTQSSCNISSAINSTDGTYEVSVTVTDASGYSKSKTLSYTVTKSFLNTSDILDKEPYANTAIPVTLSSSGATSNVTYTVSYATYNTSTKATGTYQTVMTQTLVAGKILSPTFKIANAGTYIVKVVATCGNKSETVTKVITTSYAPLVNTSTLSSDTIVVGGVAKVKAQSTGGTGTTTYKVQYASVSSTSFTTVKVGTDGYYTLSGLKAGTYIVKVTATGSNGSKTVTAVTELTLTVKSASTLATNQKLVSSNGVELKSGDTIAKGEKILFYDTLADNVTATYQYKKASDTSWTNMTADEDGTYMYCKPAKATDYNIRIVYKNAVDGTTKTLSYTIKVVDRTVYCGNTTIYYDNNVVKYGDNLSKGAVVKVVTTPKSGVTVAYQVQPDGDTKWYSLTKASDGKSATITPKQTKLYTYKITYSKSGVDDYVETFTLNMV